MPQTFDTEGGKLMFFDKCMQGLFVCLIWFLRPINNLSVM